MTDKLTNKLTETELEQFTGTEVWYRHGINRKVTYTEGVQYMAERAGAYWLIDSIAIHNLCTPEVQRVEGQFWKLRLDAEGNGATLTCEDGDGHAMYSERISFTDFPLPEITLYCMDDVILLPSEY